MNEAKRNNNKNNRELGGWEMAYEKEKSSTKTERTHFVGRRNQLNDRLWHISSKSYARILIFFAIHIYFAIYGI